MPKVHNTINPFGFESILSPAIVQTLFWVCIVCTVLLTVQVVYRITGRRRFLFSWVVLALSALSLLFYGISNSFTSEGINEATWYHVRFGLRGIGWEQIQGFALLIGTVVLAFALLCWMSWKKMGARQKRGPISTRFSWGWTLLLLASLLTNPALLQTGHMLLFLVGRPAAQAELRAQMVYPTSLPSAPSRPKSLVYVYGESLERTFLDEDLFPGLAPNLLALEAGGVSVRGMRQAPFTGWTIAGMEASQCGFPIAGIKNQPCVGDVLKNAGYHLVYMGGADGEFAGKNEFYEAHGFSEILDREQILKRLPDKKVNLSEWGLYDDDLFAAAFAEFQRLSREGKPFGLFMITLTTHPPSGYKSKSCQRLAPYMMPGESSSDPMLDAVHCSDTEVASFVRRIEAEHNPDVMVVVGSDHLQMLSSIAPVLQKNAVARQNLWFARAPWLQPEVLTRSSATFDIAPTVLGLLGLDMPALGLGRDLRSSAPTLIEKLGQDRLFRDLRSGFVLNSGGAWTQTMMDAKDEIQLPRHKKVSPSPAALGSLP